MMERVRSTSRLKSPRYAARPRDLPYNRPPATYPPLGLSPNRVTVIFALGMRDFLAGIGLAFLVATSFSLLGGYRDNQKKHAEPTWEDAFRALGLGAFVVWLIVGLGLISWLVVLTFGLFVR